MVCFRGLMPLMRCKSMGHRVVEMGMYWQACDCEEWIQISLQGVREKGKGDRRGVVGGLFHVSAWRGLVSGSDGKERDHHEVNDTRSTTEYARFHG
jgi:hypothetical protein